MLRLEKSIEMEKEKSATGEERYMHSQNQTDLLALAEQPSLLRDLICKG